MIGRCLRLVCRQISDSPLGGTCLSGPPSEGRACRVRQTTFHHPSHFPFRRDPLVGSVASRLAIHPSSSGMTGMPLRTGTINVPLRFRPSKGRACRVRGIPFDDPSHFDGHDKCAPRIWWLPSPWIRIWAHMGRLWLDGSAKCVFFVARLFAKIRQ